MKKVLVVFCVLLMTLTACSQQKDLVSAIKNGDVQGVLVAIDKKADVNSVDSDGNAPVIIAATMGNYEIVETLLKNGADANAVSVDDKSLLEISLEKFTTQNIFDLMKFGVKDEETNIVYLAEAAKRFDFLTKFYSNKGDIDKTIEYATLAIKQSEDDYYSLCLSADAYVEKSKNTEKLDQKVDFAKAAIKMYDTALLINKDAPISAKESAQNIVTTTEAKIENNKRTEEAKQAEKAIKKVVPKSVETKPNQSKSLSEPTSSKKPENTTLQQKPTQSTTVEQTRTYTRWAEQGAVITKNDPTSSVYGYKKKCDVCGNVENGSTTTASGVNSTFTCTKCKNRQKIVIKTKINNN